MSAPPIQAIKNRTTFFTVGPRNVGFPLRGTGGWKPASNASVNTHCKLASDAGFMKPARLPLVGASPKPRNAQ